MRLRFVACVGFVILFAAACRSTAPESEPEAQEAQAVASSPVIPSASESGPNNTVLIKGKWVSTKDADTGFEPWVYFDDHKVHGDGYEEGTPYRLEGDQIIYESVNGTSTTRIIELSETRFVEESEDGLRTVWIKAEL